MTHNEMFGRDERDQEHDDAPEMERLGPIDPIFIPEENYSICGRCRHEIMVTADGSHYCACNERDFYEKFGEIGSVS